MAPEAEEPRCCKEKLFQTRFLAQGRPERIQIHLKEVAKLLGAYGNGASRLWKVWLLPSGCSVRLGPFFWTRARVWQRQSHGWRAEAGNQGRGGQSIMGLLRPPAMLWCAGGTLRMNVFPNCKLGENWESHAPGGKKSLLFACMWLPAWQWEGTGTSYTVCLSSLRLQTWPEPNTWVKSDNPRNLNLGGREPCLLAASAV